MRLSILLFFFIIACTPNESASDEVWPLPHHGFPPLPFPENNPPTEAKVQLGRRLFFDPILSRDSSISCGSCHLPEKAFADGNPVSVGIKGRIGKRNVPTVVNTAYHPYFFLEGGNPTLETQMLGPLETHEEMDFTIAELIHRLAEHPEYPKLFEEVFPDMGIHAFSITASIASYERALLSGDSPFDRYYYFGENTLNETELHGWKLFQTHCNFCHQGHLLTHFKFENIGLYEEYADLGRMRVTRDSSDIGKVKTPSLRNVALSAPYMHDGSMATLSEVIEHYNRGGFSHPNKSPFVKPLSLSEYDKQALEAFLMSLTDQGVAEK
jgi:cytochrome c peroxidase